MAQVGTLYRGFNMHRTINYIEDYDAKILTTASQSYSAITAPMTSDKGKVELFIELEEGISRTSEIMFRIRKNGTGVTPWYYTGLQLPSSVNPSDTFYVKWFLPFNSGDTIDVEATCNVASPNGASMKTILIVSDESRLRHPEFLKLTHTTALSGKLGTSYENVYGRTLAPGKYKVNFLLSGAIYTAEATAVLYISGGLSDIFYLSRQTWTSSSNDYFIGSIADNVLEINSPTTIDFRIRAIYTSSNSEFRKILGHVTLEQIE